jgi:CheY-like chemotaxis protein
MREQDPSRAIIPIVAVTAFEDDDTINRCKSIGMSAVIHKPVSSAKLDQVLLEYYFNL